MFSHPFVPDTFGDGFIRGLPGAALEHRVVGNTGLQTGAGRILGWNNFALIQLDREEAFGCRQHRVKGSAQNMYKW